MKRISLYLHENIIETLKCFGEVNDVINTMLKQCVEQALIFDGTIQSAPSREGAKRIDVNISKNVLSELCGIGVRPIVYWFVENEIYSDLGWETCREYGADKIKKLNMQFDRTLAELDKLNRMCNNRLEYVIDMVKQVRVDGQT